MMSAEARIPDVLLERYRLRWQIELTFKRLKSMVQLGHVPQQDDQSSRAWLYGKLLWRCLARSWHGSGVLFPPGATTCSNKTPIRSQWREFQFAFHRVLEAIAPAVPLETVLTRWNAIAAALGERNRKRKPQISASR